ncbi:hypothetical protein GGR57DRAFT_455463 [Xylariaceae sp. FL1272]|nr:hypothetical protein GGR57DRAFT_455463 [Xylariaceae sp. FL1272]
MDMMRKHCPGAEPVGVARLRGWRWFVSERGFANIVKVSPPEERVIDAIDTTVCSDADAKGCFRLANDHGSERSMDGTPVVAPSTRAARSDVVSVKLLDSPYLLIGSTSHAEAGSQQPKPRASPTMGSETKRNPRTIGRTPEQWYETLDALRWLNAADDDDDDAHASERIRYSGSEETDVSSLVETKYLSRSAPKMWSESIVDDGCEWGVTLHSRGNGKGNGTEDREETMKSCLWSEPHSSDTANANVEDMAGNECRCNPCRCNPCRCGDSDYHQSGSKKRKGEDHGVYGLVYRMTRPDWKQLNRAHGIPDIYQRREVEAEWIATPNSPCVSSDVLKVTTYVDLHSVQPSAPDVEYAKRMDYAVHEGTGRWGLPEKYVDDVVRPFIPECQQKIGIKRSNEVLGQDGDSKEDEGAGEPKRRETHFCEIM